MARRAAKLIPEDFDPLPSQATVATVGVVADLDGGGLDAVGHLVRPGPGTGGDGGSPLPADLGVTREVLVAAGFDGSVGSILVLPGPGGVRVAVGAGPLDEQSPDTLRDAAAAFARATERCSAVGLHVDRLGGVPAEAAGRALTEGFVLARYRYTALRTTAEHTPLDEVRLALAEGDADDAAAGSAVGLVTARAGAVARDLTNTPAGHLTATDLADAAVRLGAAHGFEVTAYGPDELVEMGCGGLLGVNLGSVEEPRLLRLSYSPDGAADGHLALVGKGIMYDSGGISLKPSDPMHLLMKMDMGGAAAVLGAFTALRDLGVRARVTGWLSCTDNMPSGGAYMLGDVLHIRGGTTVEVKNTDAEGRLVMADALVLAAEDSPSAIVDIATLTGAALLALGPSIAPVIGTDPGLVDQVRAASSATGEAVWELPLERRYRRLLDSQVADISNLGGPLAGTVTAALFLAEFVGGTPWAHLDIAGTMQSEKDESWHSAGATGYGARLLAELARAFTVPA